MKRLILVIIFTFSVLYSQGSIDNNAEIIEEVNIREAVENLYIKGLKIRDFTLIEKICIPDVKLMGVNREDKLNVTDLKKWSKRFDPDNPPFKKLEAEIVKIDRDGKSAQVKIKFLINSKTHITDSLNMLKIEGEWKIVNIIDF